MASTSRETLIKVINIRKVYTAVARQYDAYNSNIGFAKKIYARKGVAGGDACYSH